ncbi:MAG: hypothetical protein AAB557_05695 [Patescibacteria group bacterium]
MLNEKEIITDPHVARKCFDNASWDAPLDWGVVRKAFEAQYADYLDGMQQDGPQWCIGPDGSMVVVRNVIRADQLFEKVSFGKQEFDVLDEDRTPIGCVQRLQREGVLSATTGELKLLEITLSLGRANAGVLYQAGFKSAGRDFYRQNEVLDLVVSMMVVVSEPVSLKM